MRRFPRAVVIVASGCSAVLAAVALSPSRAAERNLSVAPAFNARDLTAPPTRNWITNGGNVYNQRYSPLTLLDRSNVKDLKARQGALRRGLRRVPRRAG